MERRKRTSMYDPYREDIVAALETVFLSAHRKISGHRWKRMVTRENLLRRSMKYLMDF